MSDDLLDPDVWAGLRQLPADAVAKIIDVYVQSSLAVLTQLRAAGHRGDSMEFRRLVHQLKGSSAVMGVLPLSALCAAIETQDPVDVTAQLPQIESAYEHGALTLAAERAALLRQRA